MPGSSRGTRRDLRALLGVRRVGSGLGRARGRRAEEGAHRRRACCWIEGRGKLPISGCLGRRLLRRARSAAAGGLCGVHTSCAGCAKWLNPAREYKTSSPTSVSPLEITEFLLKTDQCSPSRRSHAYLTPARLCAAGFSLQGGRQAAPAKALALRKEHSQNSQFIAILTTAASCSTLPRETRSTDL